ncbi:MAG: hypothetical protein FWD52_04145 [Candidatus Bathyarchaeota archaeon]|nr:hypothetical protein [Candidatus Termiticorpusculum sp.]
MVNQIIKNFSEKHSKVHYDKLVTFFEREPANSDVADLAIVLASSGEMISQNDFVDIPSTGGPSSLSTLLCPLLLNQYGLKVLKLGVNGRPAGGIDVLAQIPSYKIDFSRSELIDTINSGSKYVHFKASKHFTPLDARLFSYRRKMNKVSVPALAISSILSKKIALGVKNICLDVRTSSFGNFGTNRIESIKYSKQFNSVAKLLGITSICYISNADMPYQPYIGRGESLIALSKILSSASNEALQKHIEFCNRISSVFASSIGVNKKTNESLTQLFFENLEKQGSNRALFYDKVNELINQKRYIVCSKTCGYVIYNLEQIKNFIVKLQESEKTATNIFPDPAGVELLKKPFEYVEKNEPILSIRCKDVYITKFIKYKSEMYTLHKKEPKTDYFEEVVT